MEENNEKDELSLFGESEAVPDTASVPETETTPVVDEVSEVIAAPPSPVPADGSTLLRGRFVDSGAGSLGEFLRHLRESNGFSIADLAAETNIKRDYLEWMEAEDWASLPQPVYVLAYARKLFALYRVPVERADELTADLREKLEYELPEDINKSVIDREVSEENEKQLRRLSLLFIGAAVIVLLALAGGGMLLLSRINAGHEPTPIGPEFESSRLLSLQPRPEIKITELKMP